jgi:hypothetical protein
MINRPHSIDIDIDGKWHPIKVSFHDPTANNTIAQKTATKKTAKKISGVEKEGATNATKRNRPTFASKIVANVALTNATTVQFSGGPARIVLARFAVHVATCVRVIIHGRMSGFVIGLRLSPTIKKTMAVPD